MSDEKPIYVLCPRCELNYIKSTEKYCDVCKVELGLLEKSFLIQEEELEAESGKLCPVCHANYIGEDEEMCFICQKEKEAKEHAEEEESEENWTYEAVEEPLPPEDIGMDLASDEEAEEEEDEEFEQSGYSEVDDFNYEVDPKDFEDYDEDEEDDDEDDEDED